MRRKCVPCYCLMGHEWQIGLLLYNMTGRKSHVSATLLNLTVDIFFRAKSLFLGGLTPWQFSPINVNLKGDTFGPNFDLLPNKMISGFQIHFCYVPFCWTKDPIFCWFSSPTILEVFLFPFMGFSSQRCM